MFDGPTDRLSSLAAARAAAEGELLDADDRCLWYVGIHTARAMVAARDRLAMDFCRAFLAHLVFNGVDGLAIADMAAGRGCFRNAAAHGYLGQLQTSVAPSLFPFFDADGLL